MKSLEGRVAVVAGASRGAGRGIALALGSAGCTVYAVGRTSRAGAPATDGAPGTVEDTAEGVTDRGGRGVAVVADCGDPLQAAAVVDRVRQEQGRLDVLANAVWGGHDGVVTPADLEAAWGRPFWEQPARQWATMMTAGPCAYYLMSAYAIPLMLEGRGGLIVGLTDGIADDGKGGSADEIVVGRRVSGAASVGARAPLHQPADGVDERRDPEEEDRRRDLDAGFHADRAGPAAHDQRQGEEDVPVRPERVHRVRRARGGRAGGGPQSHAPQRTESISSPTSRRSTGSPTSTAGRCHGSGRSADAQLGGIMATHFTDDAVTPPDS